MRIGITLPQFRAAVDPCLVAAGAAEAGDLDGVFVFDHVWAIGQPHRPAQNAWPLLGALAAETSRVTLGTLVARVSLLPNAVLVHKLESLHRMLGDRLVAGLGTGDRLSEAENEAVGVPFPSVAKRLAELADVCVRTRSLGITTWVGGRSERVRQLARTHADALNLWGVEPERVADETEVEVTWGGPALTTVDGTADLLSRLEHAGATWAIASPPYGTDPDPTAAVELVAEAARRLQ